MATFKIEFENGNIKKTLNVMGKEFSYTMRPSKYGMDGDNACFQAQIEQLHPEWVENSDIYSALDDLDFGDEDEIQEALKIISQIDND
jgi:hypothetical protein